MNKKQSLIFQIVMILFLCVIVFLSAILNAYSFSANAISANNENTAAVLSMLIERSEYGLKYGRDLSNYYDIESVLSDIEKYCGTEHRYIITTEGELLYGGEVPENIRDHITELADSGNKYLIWEDRDMQHMLMEIAGRQDAAGYVGVFYPTSITGSFSDTYVRSILIRALIGAALGALLFEILFFTVKHRFNEKKLKRLVLGTVLAVSTAMVISTWTLLQEGYVTLSERVTTSVLELNAGNMENLVESGVQYGDIQDMEAYYERISSSSEQLEKLAVTEEPDVGSGVFVELPTDGAGNTRDMTAVYSQNYDDHGLDDRGADRGIPAGYPGGGKARAQEKGVQ